MLSVPECDNVCVCRCTHARVCRRALESTLKDKHGLTRSQTSLIYSLLLDRPNPNTRNLSEGTTDDIDFDIPLEVVTSISVEELGAGDTGIVVLQTSTTDAGMNSNTRKSDYTLDADTQTVSSNYENAFEPRRHALGQGAQAPSPPRGQF